MKISITTAGKGGAIIAIEPKKIKEFTSHLRTYGVSSVKESTTRANKYGLRPILHKQKPKKASKRTNRARIQR